MQDVDLANAKFCSRLRRKVALTIEEYLPIERRQLHASFSTTQKMKVLILKKGFFDKNDQKCIYIINAKGGGIILVFNVMFRG